VYPSIGDDNGMIDEVTGSLQRRPKAGNGIALLFISATCVSLVAGVLTANPSGPDSPLSHALGGAFFLSLGLMMLLADSMRRHSWLFRAWVDISESRYCRPRGVFTLYLVGGVFSIMGAYKVISGLSAISEAMAG
jgi:hypothetical protein